MLKEYNVFGDVNRSSASKVDPVSQWIGTLMKRPVFLFAFPDAVKRGKPQRNTDEKLDYDIHIDYTNAA